VVLCLSVLLIAWNNGRNPQSAVFFVFSIIPAILTVSFAREIFVGSGLGGPDAIGAAQIAMLGIAVVLLTACSLMSAWSLTTRMPLASVRGASVL
jgi:ABC-type Na+ efflux pump permease subunit